MRSDDFTLAIGDLDVDVHVSVFVLSPADDGDDFTAPCPESVTYRIAVRSIKDENGNNVARPESMTPALVEKELFKQYGTIVDQL